MFEPIKSFIPTHDKLNSFIPQNFSTKCSQISQNICKLKTNIFSLIGKACNKPFSKKRNYSNNTQGTKEPESTSTPSEIKLTAEENFRQNLQEWENDPSVSGDKREAARRIQEAYDSNYSVLELGFLALTSLPSSIGNLSALTYLDLSHNLLKSLPDFIGNLTALTYLDLSHNLLKSLPDFIGNLTALTDLYLEHNQLQSLPTSIGNLSALTGLYLSNNQLLSLPNSIGNLSALTSLFLSNNQLQSLPDSITALSALTSLSLSNNQLLSLPVSIGNLPSLTVLDLSNNQLQSLPDSIGNLSALTHLYLSHNQLKLLPDSFRNLTSLTTLNLSHNLLKSLPAFIGNLSALTSLNLSANPTLNNLPLSLGNIPGITFLNTRNTAIPQAIVNAILAQCRAQRDLEAIERLPSKIVTWQTVANQKENHTYSSDFLNNLSDEQKRSIYEWLVRLEKTRDFHINQADLTDIVCSMLETLSTNEPFNELFFIQVDANLECCDDRAAMALNEIYTSWKIHTMPTNASTKEKLELLVGVAKTEELRITISQNIEGKNESESVEIYLYYEHKLRERLNLVTAIKDMRYATIGNSQWINEKTLIESVEDNYIASLVKYPVFEALAIKDPTYAEAKAKILDESHQKLEKIEEKNADHSGNLNDKSKTLKNEKEEKIIELTRDWVAKNSR